MFGAGVSLYVGATGCNLCPVAAVLSYLAARPNTLGPLFIHHDGRPLSCPGSVRVVWSALASGGVDTSRYKRPQFSHRGCHNSCPGRATGLIHPDAWSMEVMSISVVCPHSTFPAFSSFGTALALSFLRRFFLSLSYDYSYYEYYYCYF